MAIVYFWRITSYFGTNRIPSTLMRDIFLFSDIDECGNDTLNKCEQTCLNIPGSFSCECDSGYSLNSSGFDCDGKYYLDC